QTSERELRGDLFAYTMTSGERLTLEGPRELSFVEGVPTLPSPATMNTLRSWTLLPDEATSNFSGTARYSIALEIPESWDGDMLLAVGTVKESARVGVNGNYLEARIGPRYSMVIGRELLAGRDTLEVEVSNLMANGIADLDRRGVFWKRFYNVNFPARLAANRKDGLFDASAWTPLESGLLGPVMIAPVKEGE